MAPIAKTAELSMNTEVAARYSGNNWERSPAAVVDISPQAQVAYAAEKAAAAAALEGCQTCKNRRYVDKSDDPSVSFQTPTHIGPGESASMVMAHEQEHVSNEQAKADRDGRKVVSQTVSISTAICPECGRVYVSGGETRTVTKGESKPDEAAALEDLGLAAAAET